VQQREPDCRPIFHAEIIEREHSIVKFR
jgi:hypothetical protein